MITRRAPQLLLLLWMWMVGSGCVASAPPTTPPDPVEPCTATCAVLGEDRCSGSVLEGCVEVDACLVWVAGVDCASLDRVCVASGHAATCEDVSTCIDGLTNGDETDRDCGGPDCLPCAEGAACDEDLDCLSSWCDPATDTCAAGLEVSCDNQVVDGEETDLDCGGPACDPCEVGAACDQPEDCISAICDGTCSPPSSCLDAVVGGGETDVDCGGAVCAPCETGRACLDPADCLSGSCVLGTCVPAAPTCEDGVVNGDETDLDCGGPTCEPCGVGDTCVTWIDCLTGNCDVALTATCLFPGEPSCGDGLWNGTESDVDCGGTICDPCPEGRACGIAEDCASGACDAWVTDLCVATGTPTCADDVRDGNESDVDCGGADCPPCAQGEDCSSDDDCGTGWCDSALTGACLEPGSCDDLALNQDESDVDCGGLACDSCDEGAVCADHGDCATAWCDPLTSLCLPDPSGACTDGLMNQAETDVDCGGGSCAPCALGATCGAHADCATAHCDAGWTDVCVLFDAETCTNDRLDQDETATDCGGAICSPCVDGLTCGIDADCASDQCDITASGLCVPEGTETCSDALQNRDEADLDCGGLFCAPCDVGATCLRHLDCASSMCDLLDTGTCLDGVSPGARDEDFETGDLSAFSWEAERVAVDATDCLAGSCALTSTTVGQDATLTLALSVRDHTEVRFHARVDGFPGEDQLVFAVDGVAALTLDGGTDWAEWAAPVPATGPGDPDRVLSWTFHHGLGGSPAASARLDDIDLPDWNSAPQLRIDGPGDGLRTPTTPVIRWVSLDLDQDAVVHRVELDDDPLFGSPTSSGELDDSAWDPGLLPAGIWYWRMALRDDVDRRWSDWTPTRVFHVDPIAEEDHWAALTPPLLARGTVDGLTPGGSGVQSQASSYAITAPRVYLTHDATPVVFSFPDAPTPPPGTPASITIEASGDLDDPDEWIDVNLDGLTVGIFAPATCGEATASWTVDDIAPLTPGGLELSLTPTAYVNGGCLASNTVGATIAYDWWSTGTLVSPPIRLDTVAGADRWEAAYLDATGDVLLRVLREDGQPLPDSLVPGNSAGSAARSIHLWSLDPAAFPVVRLEADVGEGGAVHGWELHADTGFDWPFEHGHAEGWTGANGSASVEDGSLSLTSTIALDADLVYAFPSPVGAEGFSTVRVALRTSSPAPVAVELGWSSNWGAFDPRRSRTVTVPAGPAYTELVVDLGAAPIAPEEAWQGDVDALRLSPQGLDGTLDVAWIRLE